MESTRCCHCSCAPAGQWQHAERELASDPAVVVAGKRELTAIANEVDHLGGRCRDKPHDVAQAPDLFGGRPIDRGEYVVQRVEVAVDVGDHSDAHQWLHVQDIEDWWWLRAGYPDALLERIDQVEQLVALPHAAPLALVEPVQDPGTLELLQGVADGDV